MFRLDTCYTVPWDDPSSSGRHNLESRRRLMKRVLLFVPAVLVVVACEDTQQPTMSAEPRTAARIAVAARSLSFTNTPLLRPDGNSEPEISIAGNGTMAMVGLSLGLAADKQFGTSLWTGPFGATPTFQGIIDAALQQPGRVEFGGEDADVDFGSTGTLHLTTLIFLGNPTTLTGQLGVSAIPRRTFRGVIDAALQQPGRVEFGGEDADVDFGSTGTLHLTTLIFLGNPTILTGQLGVSAITCRNAAASFSAAGCQSQIIDLTQSDRPWTTSDGSRVFISYHDAGSSTLIHLQRSDDDGFTWQRVGDPIVGQGRITGDATFTNDQGPVVADVL